MKLTENKVFEFSMLTCVSFFFFKKKKKERTVQRVVPNCFSEVAKLQIVSNAIHVFFIRKIFIRK